MYGIERRADSLQLATQLIRSHGYDESRFIPIHGLSHEVEPPERAQVILSETLDCVGIGENTAHYMLDARRRLLNEGGCFLPARLQCSIALASPQAYVDRYAFWRSQMWERYGLDYAAVGGLLRRQKHVVSVEPDALFSAWVPWLDIDFGLVGPGSPVEPRILEVQRAGCVHGVAAAFDATLAADIHIRTFPSDPPTHWQQGFLPFPERPLTLQEGDLVYVEIEPAASEQPTLSFELRVATGPAPAIRRHAERRRAELAA